MTSIDERAATGVARGADGSAVSLRGVTRLFDGMTAISHIRLDVAVGETLWLRGPNGSGKSTLLRVVATALSATFGSGTVLGCDLARDRAAIRARSELLGHGLRMYGELTAVENLRFVATLYGHGQRYVDVSSALAAVGLDDVADIRVASFSQGMRQRLALARCHVRDAELLLLDEPWAGLDSDARVVVDDLLRTSRARGRTVLLASHEPPPDHLVDRVLDLDGGRVIATPTGAP